jgi:hypothetical protein
VQLAAAVGQPYEDIAQLLGISRNTLRARFSEELETGAAHANFKVGQNLFAMATGDPTLRTTLIAAIWWSKSRMGWRGTPAAGQASNHGSRCEFQIVIVSQDQDCRDESAPPLSDPDQGPPLGADPTPTGSNPCEEALDIELYQASANHWQEVAHATSDMTLHAAFTEVTRAFERLAFVAARPAESAMTRPERKIRARR